MPSEVRAFAVATRLVECFVKVEAFDVEMDNSSME
jgi:hypothetical protein